MIRTQHVEKVVRCKRA